MTVDVVLATRREAGDLTLEVVGTLGLSPAEQLKAHYDHLARRGVTSIEVNLARTECITSVGLSALAGIWEKARDAGIPFRFTHVSRDILKLFEVAGLREYFVPDA